MARLVDMGYLDIRNNPKYRWDRTYQYRVNIIKIEKDLAQIGYSIWDVLGEDARKFKYRTTIVEL